jgi:serine/threonine protein kinase
MTSVETRLSDLIMRWDESRRRGQTISLETLCSDCPDLQEELGRRIEALSVRAMEPMSGASESRPSGPASPATDGSGLVIAGYEILGELGHGGMGVVYRAYDQTRQRLVAIKTVQHHGPSALYRFKQEFRTLSDVTHPNLVSLYELVLDGRTWFFTMELIDGVNFLAYVRPGAGWPGARPASTLPATSEPTGRRKPIQETLPEVTQPALQWDRLRCALRQLAEGVSALHEAGNLHRDIKPTNVLVERGGRVVLLDFGLAAHLEPTGLHQSTEPSVLGTIAYMAPEQAAGQPVSPASDWYSVGVMLYEALTGRLPFLGSDALQEKQQTEPSAPRELAPGIPDDLNALCVELLRRDPGARPTGPEVLRRLGIPPEELRQRSPTRPPPGQRVPLIGRERCLRSLADAFSAMIQGQAVVFFVHGGSGVGKSALVQHFLDDLIARDAAVVLSGRCYERESVPYKALDSLIDALCGYLGHLPCHEAEALLPRDVLSLARVFPVLQRVGVVTAAPHRVSGVPDPQELRRRAFAALRELLGRLSERRPLVLAIDDLQWGDVDSAALLADLLRPPDTPMLLLLGCYRSEDWAASPFLRALLAAEAAHSALDRRELAVEPLTPPAVEELALELLGRDDPAAKAGAEAIAREAGGSPFFVQELVHYVQAGAGLAQCPPPGEAITLDCVLWARAVGLPEGARRLLEIVAVSGRPLRQGDAFQAAGLGAEGREALAVLRSDRLIRSTGPAEHDEVETYHDRVRETVVAHLAPGVLESHHLHLALVLEAAGSADPETLAVHYQRSNRPELAGEYFALAAAQSAGALAFERAVKLYRLALEFRPAGGASERELRTGLGDALANVGRGLEAAREYLAAMDGAGVAEALELRRRAAFQYLISGHIDAGLVELRTALGGVGLTLPNSPRRALRCLLARRLWLLLRGLGFRERDASQISAADLLCIDTCGSASTGLSMVDAILGAAIQSQYLLLALRAGEPSRLARALSVEACHLSCEAGPSRRRAGRLIQTASALAERVADPQTQGMVTLARGVTLYFEGGWKNALANCDRAEALFRDRCTGATWELDTARIYSLWCLTYMGEVAELTRRRQVLLTDAKERGDLYALTYLSTYIMAIVQLGADGPEEARRELRQAMGRWTQRGFHVQHHNALLAQVYIDLYTADGAAALQEIAERWPAYGSSLLGRIQHVRIDVRQLHARSALAAAATAPDPRSPLSVAERDARRLERERVPWAKAHAAYIHAALAQARGKTSTALAQLAHAASLYAAADMPLYAAATRRRLGESLGGEEGKALVAEADAWMTAQSIRNPPRMTAMYAPGACPD